MAISKNKYILFLRGINIGGKNLISMNSLKNRDIMYKKINNMLKEKFNLNVSISLLSASELGNIINNQPIWCEIAA